MNILIVDIHESSREVIQEIVEGEGHNPILAADGTDALRGVKDSEVDVVLTEFRLPDIDGLDLLRQVREHNSNIPVILITGHGTVDTAVSAMKMGAHDYLSKPININEISRAIKSAVEARLDRGRS